MGSFKKYARKQAKRAGRALKRRYFKGKGYSNPRISQMASDVRKLKMIINSEKKNYQIKNTPGSYWAVGQVNGNNSGHSAIDVSPTPGQSVVDNGRTGDSIKLVSSVFNFMFQQQSATTHKMKVTLYLIYTIKPQGDVDNNIVKLFWKDDPTMTNTGMITSMSQIDQDFRPLFEIIGKRTITIGSDRLTGLHETQSLRMNISYNKGFGKHFRFQDDTTTKTVGQLVLVAVADRGNRSDSGASTDSGAFDTAINTGMQFSMNCEHFFYDN